MNFDTLNGFSFLINSNLSDFFADFLVTLK